MKNRLIIIILCSLTTIASAQSFFNRQGLGEPTVSGSARGTALGNIIALNNQNPGTFLKLNQTILDISILATGVIGTQKTMRRALGDIRPTAINLGFPLPTRTRLIFALAERFNQGFDIWSESIADTLCRYHIISRGGIYSLNAGVAQLFLNHICIGAQFQQLIGGSREEWQFHTPEGSIATDTIEIDYLAPGFRAGASANINPFTIAFAYDLPVTITAQRQKKIHGVTEDSARTYHIRLPHTIAGGASAGPFSRLTHIDIGGELRPWQEAKINGTLLGYRNVWRLAAGLEYELFPSHPIRFGYSMGNWYCPNLTTGKPISEKGIHIGTGIPIPKFGALDIAAVLLLREGETPAGLLRETVGKLTVTLAYQELWARRSRRWGY